MTDVQNVDGMDEKDASVEAAKRVAVNEGDVPAGANAGIVDKADEILCETDDSGKLVLGRKRNDSRSSATDSLWKVNRVLRSEQAGLRKELFTAGIEKVEPSMRSKAAEPKQSLLKIVRQPTTTDLHRPGEVPIKVALSQSLATISQAESAASENLAERHS